MPDPGISEDKIRIRKSLILLQYLFKICSDLFLLPHPDQGQGQRRDKNSVRE